MKQDVILPHSTILRNDHCRFCFGIQYALASLLVNVEIGILYILDRDIGHVLQVLIQLLTATIIDAVHRPGKKKYSRIGGAEGQ